MHVKSWGAGRLVDKGTQRRPSLTNGRGMCELTLNTDEILLIWRSSSPITSLFSPLHETNCFNGPRSMASRYGNCKLTGLKFGGKETCQLGHVLN